MLSGKEKRYLRSLANTMEPIVQVGKGSVNESVLFSLKMYFNFINNWVYNSKLLQYFVSYILKVNLNSFCKGKYILIMQMHMFQNLPRDHNF